MSGEDLVGVIFGGLVILPLLLTTALLITYGVWLIIGLPILWFIRYRARTVEQKVQHWQQLGAECRSFCRGVWKCIVFVPRFAAGLFKVALWICGIVIVLAAAGGMASAVYEAVTVKALLFILVVTTLMAVVQAKR